MQQQAKRIQAHAESNYRIMFMRYLSLAILASTALPPKVRPSATATKWLVISVTFDWDIERKMDTPASPLT
jgi:hypothetical protein